MKNCPFCNASNSDDSIFCLACGQNMSTAPVSPATPPEYQAPQQSYYSQPPVVDGYSQQNPAPYAQPMQSAPYASAPGVVKPGDASKNWAAILGMILGILSIVLCCIYFLSPFFAVGGLIFSIMGLKSQRKGMAIAGLITSILGTLIAVGLIMMIVFAVAMPDWLAGLPGFEYSFDQNLFKVFHR